VFILNCITSAAIEMRLDMDKIMIRFKGGVRCNCFIYTQVLFKKKGAM